MPFSLPIVQKKASYALMGYFPMGNAILVNLLNDGFCHKEEGTYAELPQLLEVEDVAAICRNSWRRLGVRAIRLA